jgi:pimeloyl-ACP methyl ester carboxylesterase
MRRYLLPLAFASVASQSAHAGQPKCEDYYNGMASALAPAASRWCAEGDVMTWQSRDWNEPIELFYHCEGDPTAPAIYLQHGWPTSGFDFQDLSSQLATDFYVCALDTPGYGFSDKPDGYPYSILEDAYIVETFIEDVMQAHTVTLLTHDKGDSVGLELLVRLQTGTADFALQRHVLLNGSIILGEADISWFQKALLNDRTGPRLSRRLTGAQLAAALGDSTYNPGLTEQEEAEWATVFDFDDGTDRLHQTIQYLNEREEHEHTRWLAALADSPTPTVLVWGEMDPIAGPDVADTVWTDVLLPRAAPAEYWRLPNASHYVQNDRMADVEAIIRGDLPSYPTYLYAHR